jgi:uncharacterized protein GlcG (DUF336 family)
MTINRPRTALVALSLLFSASTFAEELPMLVDIKRMTVETAARIAQATIAACRQEGMQIGVTVVDRGGHAQVVMRDVLAPDLTLRVSRDKAYTAMSFNSATSQLENRFTAPFSVGKTDGLVMSAGGLPIRAGGTLVGAVGVSGAPSGVIDERCAQAGIDEVQADLDMADM